MSCDQMGRQIEVGDFVRFAIPDRPGRSSIGRVASIAPSNKETGTISVIHIADVVGWQQLFLVGRDCTLVMENGGGGRNPKLKLVA